MEISQLFTIILSILVLISLGFLAKATKLLKTEDVSVINKVIIYFTIPALVFQSVIKSQALNLGFLKIPALALIIMAICGVAAFLVTRFWSFPPKLLGSFLLVSMMGNTGYLGYPLTLEIYGPQNLIKAVFYDLFGTVIFAFTVGLYVAEIYGESDNEHSHKSNKLKEILLFPPVIALIAGLLFRLGLPNISLPHFLLQVLDYLSIATIPLIMMSIGLSLRLGEIRSYKTLLLSVVVIKLALSPLVAFLIGRAAFASFSDLGVFVLEASMPSMMISLVIGLRYKLDVSFIPTAILATTLISLVTIPIWQYLLSLA